MTDPTPADIPSLVELKPCPLCGCKLVRTGRPDEWNYEHLADDAQGCLLHNCICLQDADDIDAWNWRTPALSPKEDAVGGGERLTCVGPFCHSPKWCVDHCACHRTPAVEGIPAGMVAGGWQSMSTAPKDGTLLELVVDYTDGDHPLQDAIIAPTIGYNGLDDTGEDEWKFAGWCWTHDHFTEGRGTVIAWRPSRLNANGDDGSLGPLDTYTPQARPTASDGEAREALDALRWLRAFWKPGSNHDTEEVKHALATADAVLAKADAILAALPTSDGAAMRAAPTWLEERPDDKGGFDEFVARFADGMVHAEMMNDKGLYIGLYRDDGRIYQFWVSSDKKLTCHGESSDGPATPPTTDPSERMREAYRDGLSKAAEVVRRWIDHEGDLAINLDTYPTTLADKPTLIYVAETLEQRVEKSRGRAALTPTNNEVSDEG